MKIIGITCSEQKEVEKDLQLTSEEYIYAIEKAGAIPLLLPITENKEVIEHQVQCIDGLLLTGGIDVNPCFYNECYRFEQGESSMRRDLYEIELIKKCVQKKKPMLGICRGLQVMNVAFGGALYQDNKLAGSFIQQHQQKERREYPIHSICIEDHTFLSSIFGNKTYVNSFHHQSISRVADHFMVVARSEDNIIEAIQHQELPFFAVQFHPETMCQRDQKMQLIFNQFVSQCDQ